MTRLRVLWSRARNMVLRRGPGRDLDDEILFHIEMRTDDNLRAGMSPEEARRLALVEFGGVERVKEEYRERLGLAPVETLLQDMRFAVRTLRRRPAFSLTVIAVLALGIGVNATLFGLVDRTLLRSAPLLSRPDRLARLTCRYGSTALPTLSHPDFEATAEHTTTFSSLACYQEQTRTLVDRGAGRRLRVVAASTNYFTTLGVEPAVGRAFLPSDDEPQGEAVVILSHAVWRAHFAGDPAIVGRGVTLDGLPFTVIGVAPEGFVGVEPAASLGAWVPIGRLHAKGLEDRRALTVQAVGRLRDGVDLERARAELQVLGSQLEQSHPTTNTGRALSARGWVGIPGDPSEALVTASTLMAVVGLVLAVACSNIANLLLARASARRPEIAVRLAMGARRSRVVRQLLTESAVLALLGGALGLLFASLAGDLAWRALQWGSDPIAPSEGPWASLDAAVVWYAFGLSLATTLLFGLAPALQATRLELSSALSDGAPTVVARGARTRTALMVGQVAVSAALLTLASLLLRTLGNQYESSTPPSPEQVLLVSIEPGEGAADASKGQRLYRDVLAAVRSLPGVESATLADRVEIGSVRDDIRLLPEGAPPSAAGEGLRVAHTVIAPDYFTAVSGTLTAGRDFDEHDDETAPRVAVVNEAAARACWPGQNPLGRRLRVDDGGGTLAPPLEIVGLVRDGRDDDAPERALPSLYVPVSQNYAEAMTLVVRASGGAKAVERPVLEAIRTVDAQAPAADARTLSEHIDRALATNRQLSLFVGTAGVLALLLASTGLYGMVWYFVTQRTHEIGVRLALGARPSDVRRLVLAEGLKLTGVGMAVGMVVALAAANALSSLWYGVGPFDAVSYFGIAAVLGGVAMAACYLPARAASRLEPMMALREE